MGSIVVVGGGIGGLATAMLLAGDGHDVTVLERDPLPPPSPEDAWDDWERRGVNQFRLPHFLIPAFREVAERELPSLVPALEAAGGHRFNFLHYVSGGMMTDPDVDVVTARRPIVEAVVAALADETSGVTVRRGVAVGGLVAEEGTTPPRVVAVETETGERLPADLVIDATGRRSPLPAWLSAIGARPLQEECEDSGFVYYGCHVQTVDGSPFSPGPSMVGCGSISLLALPGDRGTAGVGIITTNGDAELRCLRREGPWVAAVAAVPGGQAILDAKRISPLVSMAKIEDRWCRTVVDGTPVATGIVTVADAWAATNPTLGRGISLGMRHAAALRDVVRDVGLDDPVRLALAFDEVTQRDFTPWYRSTIWHDRHRIGEARAAVEGEPYRTDDASWDAWLRVQLLPMHDPSMGSRLLGVGAMLRERPEQVLADPDVQEKLTKVELPDGPHPGPSRKELLELVASAS